MPIKHLVFKGKKPRPGQVVQLNTSDGLRPVTVTKAGIHSADIDANHPLAGRTLTFEIEVVDVRAASAEEQSHGHAHGPGGPPPLTGVARRSRQRSETPGPAGGCHDDETDTNGT